MNVVQAPARSAPTPMVEFKVHASLAVAIGAIALPRRPGEVERNALGEAVLLHVAPGSFLAPTPTALLLQRLDAIQMAGIGKVFDVCGKWQHFDLRGSDVERRILSTVDAARVLHDRECASVCLFDCPAILVGGTRGFEAWIASSYAVAFREQMTDARGSFID